VATPLLLLYAVGPRFLATCRCSCARRCMAWQVVRVQAADKQCESGEYKAAAAKLRQRAKAFACASMLASVLDMRDSS
jgi:hypothetical protein